MDVTFAVAGGTGGCNHARLTVTRVSDGHSRTLHLSRADFAIDRDGVDDDVKAVARHLVKTAGATTLAQVKAALEGRTVKL